MGSPAGPILAKPLLCHIFRRYVADIFVTFNSHEQLKKFSEYMNTKHPNTKFTFEYKVNNSSFLDVKISRKNNKLTISLYKKPTSSGVLTNSKSFIPTCQKFDLV